jgi:hypothetical protein
MDEILESASEELRETPAEETEVDESIDAQSSEAESTEQPTEQPPQEEQLPDYGELYRQLPEQMQARIQQAFEAEQRLQAQREAQQPRPQEQRPQTFGDMSEQQFNSWLQTQNQAVRQKYYQLLETDIDAADQLRDDWTERKLEIKQQRAREIQQRQTHEVRSRAEQVAHVVNTSPEYETVRWATDAAINEAVRAGVDPAWFVNQLNMFATSMGQQRAGNNQTTQDRKRQMATEMVDGGVAPSRSAKDDIDDWASKAASGLSNFML